MIALNKQWAHGRSSILSDWQARYSSSQSEINAQGAGSQCQMCHFRSNGGEPWNAYGWALREEIIGSATNSAAFQAIEASNSDDDPSSSSNLTEILEDTQPGWTIGPNNLAYFKNGTIQADREAPSGSLGSLD
ncbi:hypothetical protein, partial [Pseudooceanicola sp.]|uniref:hypothetical protein n=1 Tax=Pseudooceanicola sp. TaxID=1914328 RepID=UPI0035186F8A